MYAHFEGILERRNISLLTSLSGFSVRRWKLKAVILAGGYGTRLLEETSEVPKPMIEVGGRPLLWHIMKIFSTQGFNEFVVALGYKADVVKRYFLHYSQLESDLTIHTGKRHVEASGDIADDWKIHLVDTGLDTMTGGRLRRLRNHWDETLIFTYGDGLSNVDLPKLVEFHKSHGKLATVTAVECPSRFGQLQFDGDQVKVFAEKPKASGEWINAGFFVLEPGVLDYIDGDTTVWEGEPCERLVADGQMMAYRHEGFWQCMDTLRELRGLREQWADGEAEWKIW